MHYVIVLLFLQHFHKEARKQLAGRSNFLKYSIGHFAFLDLTFCICVVTLKSPHNLFVLPTIIKKNPSNLNPMSFLFSSPARILPTLQTKSFQPYFSLLPISKNLISLLEKSSSMQKPAVGADCSRSSPVLNPQMDCKDQRLRFIFLLSLVRVFVFFFSALS